MPQTKTCSIVTSALDEVVAPFASTDFGVCVSLMPRTYSPSQGGDFAALVTANPNSLLLLVLQATFPPT